ncbi:MAG: tyrosine-protein phosphatase [Lachnospiraceae bacterium]|nr:tyrosine-protein phosphatase [Lachnospiraceae bacterium]MBQ3401490.1 tyrosine-protein phosphatase [Lachnospiraceae bacterium]
MNENLSRKIEFENLVNTRDLGGMPAADGRKIRPGLLIRSGMLIVASEADRARLAEMLDLVLDFRTDIEHEERPDPEFPGVRNIWIPTLERPSEGVSREKKTDEDALKNLAMDPGKSRGVMSGLYRKLVQSEYSRAGYRQFIGYLAEPREKALLWHCSAGKDRAGLAAAITQEILGVPRELIYEDYLATNVYLKDDIDAIVLGAQRRMADPSYVQEELLSIAETAKDEAAAGMNDRAAIEAALPPEVVATSRHALTLLFGADRSYIEAFYQAIDETFGSVGAYLEEGLGVTPELREELRDRYLE